jgi:hypothetical protein
MRHAIAILAACGLLLLTSAASAAETAPEWPGRVGRYVFEVTRDGKPIGTQVVEIKRDGANLTVTTESTIAVKVLGIVVYRLHQVLTDIYQDRRLVEVKAETKDPDGLRAGGITRKGDQWTGKIGKQSRDFTCDCTTSSTMFHRDVLTGTQLIEASVVKLRNVTIEDKGEETLDLPEGQVQTRHFAVKGDIERDVWYDPAGNLVSARQKGSDGSQIQQNLLSDPQATRETRPEAGEP